MAHTPNSPDTGVPLTVPRPYSVLSLSSSLRLSPSGPLRGDPAPGSGTPFSMNLLLTLPLACVLNSFYIRRQRTPSPLLRGWLAPHPGELPLAWPASAGSARAPHHQVHAHYLGRGSLRFSDRFQAESQGSRSRGRGRPGERGDRGHGPGCGHSPELTPQGLGARSST